MLNTGKLAGKTLYITGASRGIGKAIALKAARDGANVVVAAKTAEPHPKLPGTIYTAAKEIEAAGGQALPCVVDVRSEEAVQKSIEEAVRQFGGLDIVVNNASAINLTNVENLPMKRFDLMHQINARGTYLVSKLAIPYLRASKKNPHIMMLSPPLNMRARWFGDHCGYTMAKYGMSMCVLGLSEELRKDGVGVNGLWPRTGISTAAMDMLTGEEGANNCRTADIMADAAYVMLTRDAKNFTGQLVIDEDVLKEEGVRDFDQYAVKKGEPLMPDFFLDEFDQGYIGDKTGKMKVGLKPKSGGSSEQKPQASPAAGGGGGGGGVAQVFERMSGVLNEELVGKTKAVYAFDIKGSDSGSYFLDLKNGSGSCGSGAPPSGEPDVTFGMKDKDFHDMFAGKLKPASAFMTGKLKLQGDMGKAMKLEKLMKQMGDGKKGYHTIAGGNNNYLAGRRFYSSDSSGTWTYDSVPEVFARVGDVASAEIVQKVGATYLFDVEGAGRYYVDLKNGAGGVWEVQGDVKETPDATIKLNQATLIRIFNRELRAAQAFMQGDMKLAGDMQKALAFEEIMRAARLRAEEMHQEEEASSVAGNSQQQPPQQQQAAQAQFHTSATLGYADPPPATYQNVPEVFERIKNVASEDIVKQVQSIYVFDVEEDGKYYVDFKNGSGDVGKGDPPSGPADVTIKMNNANFLKIFNREMSPASAFMTGQIKVSGDLARALTLEKVMKAAREAAEKAAKGGK